MTGQTKSKTTQIRDYNDTGEKWMAQAVEMYRDEQAKGDKEKKLGLKKVCEASSQIGKAPCRLDKAKTDRN
jgi:hypothetical protein